MLNSRFEVRKAAALQFRRTIDVAGYCIVDHHVMWCLSESKLTANRAFIFEGGLLCVLSLDS